MGNKNLPGIKMNIKTIITVNGLNHAKDPECDKNSHTETLCGEFINEGRIKNTSVISDIKCPTCNFLSNYY